MIWLEHAGLTDTGQSWKALLLLRCTDMLDSCLWVKSLRAWNASVHTALSASACKGPRRIWHVQVHAELILEVPVEHGLLLENLLDLAHAPFTHTSTFAKGWPIPDVVKFNAQKLLGGNWEPYPIDMAFEPPCMVLSTIGGPPAMMTMPVL